METPILSCTTELCICDCLCLKLICRTCRSVCMHSQVHRMFDCSAERVASCMQVDALLNGVRGEAPAVEWIVQQFEDLGYASWAHRIINTAGVQLDRYPGKH